MAAQARQCWGFAIFPQSRASSTFGKHTHHFLRAASIAPTLPCTPIRDVLRDEDRDGCRASVDIRAETGYFIFWSGDVTAAVGAQPERANARALSNFTNLTQGAILEDHCPIQRRYCSDICSYMFWSRHNGIQRARQHHRPSAAS